jgi:hypothetical protein
VDTDQIETSIRELEQMLPTPYYFKQLISLYRKLGKQAKKDRCLPKALEYFNRMLSLSIIWHEVYGCKESGIEGQEVDRAAMFLKRLVKARGTLYPFTYQEHGPVENDVLLSATDYSNLDQLNESAARERIEVQTTLRSTPSVGSLEVATATVAHPGTSTERVISGRRSLQKGKGRTLYLTADGQHVTIEQLALEHYRSEGYDGLWSENTYWWQIMTLLYWDVVYAQLPGVFDPRMGPFPSPMQDIPRDMFSQEFYERRQRLIQARHRFLSNASLFGLRPPSPEQELRNAWRRHQGTPCRFFHQWEMFSVEDLALATRSLAPSQLIEILDHLLLDFNAHRRGLPDLFLVRAGIPLFVEVKAQTERVARPQFEWHRFLRERVLVPVEICRVSDE